MKRPASTSSGIANLAAGSAFEAALRGTRRHHRTPAGERLSERLMGRKRERPHRTSFHGEAMARI